MQYNLAYGGLLIVSTTFTILIRKKIFTETPSDLLYLGYKMCNGINKRNDSEKKKGVLLQLRPQTGSYFPNQMSKTPLPSVVQQRTQHIKGSYWSGRRKRGCYVSNERKFTSKIYTVEARILANLEKKAVISKNSQK